MSSTTSSAKTERLLNLLIMLLVQRHYVTKDRIRDDPLPRGLRRGLREDVRARQGRAAQPRRPDRGRAAWTPTSTTSRATGSGATQFALPDIALAPDEAAVIGLATRVWQHARLADATTDAVRKLTAAGVAVDRGGPRHRRAAADGRRAGLRRVLGGHPSRTPVEFDYRRPGDDAPPPGTSSRGAWSASPDAGTSSGSTPTVARSGSSGSPGSGPREAVGAPGSYDVPAGTDVRAMARRLAPAAPTEEAVVLVRPGAGAVLRRAAARVEPDVDGPDDATPWDRLELPSGGPSRRRAARLRRRCVVERPRELRDRSWSGCVRPAGALA